MQIKTKLLAGFLSVALVAALIGGLGIYNLVQSSKTTETMYSVNTAPLGNLIKITEGLQRIRVNMRDIVLLSGEEMQDRVNRVDAINADIEKEMAEFEKSISSSDARLAYEELQKAIDGYKPIQQQVIKFALSGKHDAAIAVLLGNARAAQDIQTAIDKINSIKTSQAKDKAEQDKLSSRTAITMMVIFCLVGVGLSVGLGLYIARIITRPLNSLVEASNSISKGDLTSTIEVKSTDEIGDLAKSFRIMLNNMRDMVSAIANKASTLAASSEQLSSSSEQTSAASGETAATMNQVSSNVQIMSDKFDHIQGVVGGVTKITGDTKILSINASIEAAHAGEIGKGFAVVADEVGKLSEETKILAEQIISNVDEVKSQVNEVASSVQNVAAATEEQNAAMEEVSSTAQELTAIAQDLNELVSRYKV